MKKQLSIEKFNADLEGIEALKALHLLPSINISGIYAGYTGKGSKTVVPSIAGVKIDIRLVPKQNPEKILRNLKQSMEKIGVKNYDLTVHGMYPAGYTKPSEKIVKASVIAAEKTKINLQP
ncbi:MAG: peptidase dimerization domain-containing protein [Desulfurococcaceae archaeon]